MKRTLFAVAISACLLAVGGVDLQRAHAQESQSHPWESYDISAGKLLSFCTANADWPDDPLQSDDPALRLSCEGYIAGVGAFMDLPFASTEPSVGVSGYRVCLGGITRQEAATAFVAYAQDLDREDRNTTPAHVAVVAAWQAANYCKTGPGGPVLLDLDGETLRNGCLVAVGRKEEMTGQSFFVSCYGYLVGLSAITRYPDWIRESKEVGDALYKVCLDGVTRTTLMQTATEALDAYSIEELRKNVAGQIIMLDWKSRYACKG